MRFNLPLPGNLLDQYIYSRAVLKALSPSLLPSWSYIMIHEKTSHNSAVKAP